MKRFVMMHKADANIEAGVNPRRELIEQMGGLVGAMASANAFVSGEGLAPTAEGVRVRFTNGKRTVTRGPFVGSNELVASFAMIRVNSLDEAIDWASRIGRVLSDADLYIGRVKEPWDLGLAPKPKGGATRYLILRKSDAKTEASDADLYIGRVKEPWDLGLAPKPKGGATRYLILRKSDAKTEASDAADPDIQAGLRPVFDQMTKAAVLLAAERLLPSKSGARLTISKGKRSLVDGPFAESKELIAGYCIVSVAARDDAMAWATRFGELLCEYAPVDSVEVDVRELADGTGFA
jgi:hypothetical protein